MTNFALLANPNEHFYKTRRKDVNLIVLHVTAGLQDLDLLGVDDSARATNRYGANTPRAASWHVCVDSDSIDPALPDEFTAFHVRNYNSPSLGLEICNRDARWDNKPQDWVEATLLNAAHVCVAWEKKFGIPRRLLSKREVDSGKAGYSYHMFLDPARRRDPGETFPWDRFVQLLESVESGDAPPPPKPKKPLSRWVKEGDGNLKNGVHGPRTERVQAKVGVKVDGYFGPNTEKAVRNYQQRFGLAVDGIVGPNTWSHMFGRTVRPTRRPSIPQFPLARGYYFGPKEGPKESVSGYYSHREDLERWQQRMIDRGWDLGRAGADGLYGPRTEAVVKAFQREKRLRVDGLIGPNTWRAAWTAPVT